MLDKHHPIPVYYQLQQEIRRQIESGELKPGDLVPSERELSATYQISRMTVRQSLSNLVNEGLLVREKGRGTFVSRPRIQIALSRLVGFTQDMHARGMRSGSTVLAFEVCPASPETAAALKLSEAEPVIKLKRLRKANDAPIEVQTSYLPDRWFHDILSDNLENSSLYNLLSTKFQVTPKRAQETWEAVACPPDEASLLTIKKDAPVFRASRTTFNQVGEPFEYVRSYIRGDLYYLYIEPRID
jgi:GntR family transcriptional regulator